MDTEQSDYRNRAKLLWTQNKVIIDTKQSN